MGYEHELKVATEAARKAGRIMQERRNQLHIDHKKTRTDPVTDADRAAQEAIVERIREAFPGDGFLGEEDGLRPDGEERVWVIDPIDGTSNYAHGFPYYCTSIALTVDGESVVGVVYTPAAEEMFTAVRGAGAERNEAPIQVSDTDRLADGLFIARISDWMEGDRLRDIETRLLRDLISQPASFRRFGAAALDLCNVAAGRLDGSALVTINPWDIAAGRLIVTEAGGAVREQESVIDGYREIVASNNHLQEQLVEVFDRHVR